MFGSVEALIRPSTPGAFNGASLATLLPLPDLALLISRSLPLVPDIAFEFEVDDEPKKPFPTLNPRFRPVPGLVNFPPFPPVAASNNAPNSFVSIPEAPGVEGVEVAAELDLDMLILAPVELAVGFVDGDALDEFELPNRLPHPPLKPKTLVRPPIEGESAVPGLRAVGVAPDL